MEYLAETADDTYRLGLDPLPFRLGRAEIADAVIHCQQVSRLHAEIYQDRNRFYIRDLNSSNGTFINGRRVQEAELVDGAIVALACREFRFHLKEAAVKDHLTGTLHLNPAQALNKIHGRPLLKELLRQRSVMTLFQPIVELSTGFTLGYETLGRGTHGELSAKPTDLFGLAERYQMARELSGLFRTVALEEARQLPGQPVLFCNTHASELEAPGFFDSLEGLRQQLPAGQVLVLEIHEETTADLEPLRRLRRKLQELGILLAFDDFGAGQSRLAELAEVPPDFIKLDMGLIRDIAVSTQRQLLVKAIVRAARDLGSQVIAEGIETEAEATICEQLGCQYGQGYLLGYPTQAGAVEQEVDTCRIEINPLKESTQVLVL
ncbi:MAG: EAL domain-containing protein [Gemmataceae bacterium]|nr:EAL domain-containing protein [Gemmataceae bacterium]